MAFKLALVFLALGILPMAVVGMVAFFLAKTSMTENFIESFVERVARDAAFTLDKSLESKSDNVEVFARSPSLRENVAALEHYLPEEEGYERALDSIWDDLNSWVEIIEGVDLLAVADRTGRVIVTSNVKRPAVRRRGLTDEARDPFLWSDSASNPMRDRTVGDRVWWQDASGGRLTLIPWGSDSIVGVSYQYPYFLDVRTDLPEHRRKKNPEAFSFGFTHGIPTPKGVGEPDSAPQAILVAYFNWSVIQDVLDRLTTEFNQHYHQYRTGYPFLFAEDLDTIIAHKNKELYGTSLIHDHGLKELHEAMVDAPAHEGFHYYTYDGHKKIAGFSMVTAAGWQLGFGVDELDFYAEVRRLRNLLLICGLVTAGLIVIIIAVFSKRVTEPIRTLIRQTNEIARGNLDSRVELRTSDEIGLLGDAFNKMAEDLQIANEKRIQAEKTAAWREMARQVAHEIKNPLTPIKLSVQL
ncbi:MAG: HAMP domain-containing protein, partial [Planctomycetes bacterium]|nr:HAMP domain-containing protein [Planctomycetota bacterium]